MRLGTPLSPSATRVILLGAGESRNNPGIR